MIKTITKTAADEIVADKETMIERLTEERKRLLKIKETIGTTNYTLVGTIATAITIIDELLSSSIEPLTAAYEQLLIVSYQQLMAIHKSIKTIHRLFFDETNDQRLSLPLTMTTNNEPLIITIMTTLDNCLSEIYWLITDFCEVTINNGHISYYEDPRNDDNDVWLVFTTKDCLDNDYYIIE